MLLEGFGTWQSFRIRLNGVHITLSVTAVYICHFQPGEIHLKNKAVPFVSESKLRGGLWRCEGLPSNGDEVLAASRPDSHPLICPNSISSWKVSCDACKSSRRSFSHVCHCSAGELRTSFVFGAISFWLDSMNMSIIDSVSTTNSLVNSIYIGKVWERL